MANRLKETYKKDIVPELMKLHGYKNVNEVPKLDKIVLNMGLGDVKDNSKSLGIAIDELGVMDKNQLQQKQKKLSLTSKLDKE